MELLSEARSLVAAGSPSAALLAAAVLFLLYWIGLVVGRLYFHPLAKFPGPRVAAATSWYEAYYEIVCKGQYGVKISELHDRYGPIVRVTPHEIHIRDSRFFDTVYPKSVPVARIDWEHRFGFDEGVFATAEPAIHKRRRAALSPMFSRKSTLDFAPVIHRHIDVLAGRLGEFENRKEHINLTEALPCLTGDIVMDMSFGFNQGQMKSPDFTSFRPAIVAMGPLGHVATQFPAIHPIINSIPHSVVGKLQPMAVPMVRLKEELARIIGRTLGGEEMKTNDVRKTIFTEILHSSLPPEDKTTQRLADEALTIVAAGVWTTAHAIITATFHIASTPHIYQRLHADLVAALPDREKLELFPLEKVPYLKACIMEALRLSYGISARNPRNHSEPVRYKEWVVPPGTSLSMSVPDVSHDEDIFPQNKKFIPERWLGDPKTSDGVPLERFMVSFGRGVRSCLGINLAWTEMYLALGMVFRRYKLDLFEPDVRCVEMAYDHFVPHSHVDDKGLRAYITSTED